jgi:two-component sensor histidine kinase
MYLTALEAILLSLAFTDRYIILKEQTAEASALLVETLKNRQSVIESEIVKRTEELSLAYESKKVLLKEVHHRTKNNLQLILSLVRMQSRDSNAMVKESAKNLEYRINAIAKTQQMLYLKDDLQKIDMDEYIEELCSDLENFSEKVLTIDTEVTEIYMPLREAGYVGLILNELVTNAIKYVVKEDIEIEVKMFMQEGIYILVVSDNGDGYEYSDLQGDGIGTKLVKTLVENQLEGELEISSKKGLKYTIRFHL